MPTLAWSTIRGEVMRPLGFEDFATTTNLATNDKVISTELSDRLPSADYFIGWYVYIKGTNNVNVTRRVQDYSAETDSPPGQLTIRGANLATESAAVNCELLRFHPDDIKRALNRARQNVFPQLGILRDIETIVTGQRQFTYTVPSTIRLIKRVMLGERYEAGSVPENLLLNGDFEDWSNATSPDNWTVGGSSATVNQEEETTSPKNYAVLSGSNSARLFVPDSTVTTLLQTFTPGSGDVAIEGMEINVSAWVYATLASRVALRVTGLGDGTTHSGTGWELIKQAVTSGQTATSAQAGVSVTSGATMNVFVDEIIMVFGQSEALDKPYSPINNWDWVPSINGASDGGKLYFSEALPEKHRIRIIGVDMLASVSAETDTIEIDGELVEPLYNKVREYLCEERAKRSSGAEEIKWARMQSEYRGKYEDAINRGVGVRAPRKQLKMPDLVV
jgi:hypothetical protein